MSCWEKSSSQNNDLFEDVTVPIRKMNSGIWRFKDTADVTLHSGRDDEDAKVAGE